MKKHRWLALLIVGLVLVVATAVSVAVPLICTASNPPESVAIIGGADGPTAIYLTRRLAWELLQSRVWLFLAGVVLVIVALIIKKFRKNV